MVGWWSHLLWQGLALSILILMTPNLYVNSLKAKWEVVEIVTTLQLHQPHPPHCTKLDSYQTRVKMMWILTMDKGPESRTWAWQLNTLALAIASIILYDLFLFKQSMSVMYFFFVWYQDFLKNQFPRNNFSALNIPY